VQSDNRIPRHEVIEMAFAQQAVSEFQAIRSDEEQQYWGYEDKQYVIKLHGDYDTANILNTNDEAIRIPESLQKIGVEVLQIRCMSFMATWQTGGCLGFRWETGGARS